MQTPQTVIFFGPQGSGKGTQRELLKTYLESNGECVLDFVTGAAFRSLVQDEGYVPQRVAQIMNSGKVLQAFLPIFLWTRVITEQLTPEKVLLFDGSPRTVLEAEVLDGAFDFLEQERVAVVNLDIPHEKTIQRLLGRGRADDTKASIEERIRQYETLVKPTLEYFNSNSRYVVHTFDGDRPIDVIHQDIRDQLYS